MIWALVICFTILFAWLALGIWKDLQKAGDIFDIEDIEEE